MNTKLSIALVVITILAVAGCFLPFGGSTVVEKMVGATPGSDFYYDSLNFNGVVTYYKEVGMLKATTSLCAIKSPAATTTLERIAWQITGGTTTAATIDIGTSTTAYATTTNLVSATAVASGAQAYKYWTPVGGTVNDAMMSPNTWVNVMTAGAGLNGYTYTGKCEAVFTELP